MPVCLYIRGVPGTGKRTVADILERDLGWPVLWVHHFDAVYKAIGEYKVPELTDNLMSTVAVYLAKKIDKPSFIMVRPTRGTMGLRYSYFNARAYGYDFIPVRLTASYATLCTRITRRWHESPFRLTTKEALDEYLNARPESEFPGEHVIDTDNMTPEQVAGKIKELIPR